MNLDMSAIYMGIAIFSVGCGGGVFSCVPWALDTAGRYKNYWAFFPFRSLCGNEQAVGWGWAGTEGVNTGGNGRNGIS